MAVITAKEWDRYRANYSTMTYREYVSWHSRMWREHPDQSYFDREAIDTFFSLLPNKPLRVAEFGGWDGELAELVMNYHTIASWINQEVCEEARTNRVCTRPEYMAVSLITDLRETDVLIASHSLEHMSGIEIHRLVTMASRCVDDIYIDAPEPQKVLHSTCAHIVGNIWPHVPPLPAPWKQTGQLRTAKWFSKR